MMGFASRAGFAGLVAMASLFVACGADSEGSSRGNDAVDGTDDDVPSGDGLEGDDVASDATADGAGDDAEPPPAEAAFSMSMNSTPLAASLGASPCAATPGRLMFPTQDAFLTLSSTTPEETVLQVLEVEVDGRDDAHVSCTVHSVDEGNFEISATIMAGETGAQLELSNVFIQGQFSTSASLSWQYALDGTYSGDCAVSVDARGNGTLFIAPGVAKLTYECQLTNLGNQACAAIGTIYLNHCAE